MIADQRYTIRFFTLLASAVMLIGIRPAQAQSPAEPDDFQRFIAKKGPSLVAIKFVLKVNTGGMFGSSEDQESETEITGVMIDPKGLILCSNTRLSGFTSLIQHFMGEAGANISAKPTEMKVLIGDDTEWQNAEFLARDSELDLAWIQIKDPGDKKFAYVDFAQSATPAVGSSLLTIHRMGKHFDRCVVAGASRVGGITRKPRELYVPTTDLSNYMGMPVYTEQSKVVGVIILQLPDAEDSMGGAKSMFNRMSMSENMGGMILPADKVVKATTRAKETAKTAESQPAKSTASAPAEDEDN